MAETGDDETSHGPPPRPSPPKRKRESVVIEARASEAGPLGAPAAAPNGGREMLAGALGGVIGAALALACAWLFVAKPDLAPLDRRAAMLQAGAEAGDARMAALEAGQGTAAADRRALAQRQKAVADAQAKLADRVAALEAAAGNGGLKSAVEALNHDIAEKSQRLKAASDAEQALGTRLATLESSLPPVAADARAAKQAADKALAAVGAPSDPRLDSLAADEAAIATLRARLDKLTAPKAVTRVNPAAPTASAGPSPAARAVAAMALQSRLDAGEPLGAPLTALDRLGVAAPALAPLRPYAETGAPTLVALARALAEAKPTPHASPAPGVAQRLLGEVQGLVKVRKVGESRPGVADLSGVEAALAAGDLAGALAAFADLPPPSQAALQNWRETAQARLAAGRAAEALLARAIADLGAGR